MNNNLIDFYNEIKQATHAYCVKEQGQFQGGLESFDQYTQRHENQSVETVKEYIETCKQSFQLILSELLAARDEAAIQELIQAVNRVKAGIQNTDENKHATLKNIFGLSTALLEKIYLSPQALPQRPLCTPQIVSAIPLLPSIICKI